MRCRPLAWGEPGWLTITVEGAKAPDGQSLQSEPAVLRIFAYNLEMQEAYPYLLECCESAARVSSRRRETTFSLPFDTRPAGNLPAGLLIILV